MSFYIFVVKRDSKFFRDFFGGVVGIGVEVEDGRKMKVFRRREKVEEYRILLGEFRVMGFVVFILIIIILLYYLIICFVVVGFWGFISYFGSYC